MTFLATLNFDSGVWSFSGPPSAESPDYEIGFSSGDGSGVSFDNLQFGIEIVSDNEILLSNAYPPAGVVYEKTDQMYLTNDRCIIQPDANVTVFVWAVNAGVRYESQFSFVMPRPSAPYPSWVWSENGWAPPHFPPSGLGVWWEWDENALEWVVVPESDYEVE